MEQIRDKLKYKTVGIAGAGGLGSNCAQALVRVGVGHIIIADFDVVEVSNLNRQFYFYNQIGTPKVIALKENLLRIDPKASVSSIHTKLSPDNLIRYFACCDVVVEAFDLAVMKQMLIETMAEQLPHIPVVCGLGMAGWGNSDKIRMQKLGNLHICGDQESEVSEMLPPLAPRVLMVSGMEANEVLAILLNDFSIEL
ncbi:MAG: sulfur carrier protein ThiS adenylyltransferase ThiF [Bacteroidales bacterium]|jgi:sulfur carrier protein ThiS adenylyltransferase|nr:sulfur carrier protein ThiS adenylyltransferase ThiF [Bacteroidales bacterium]